MKCSKDCCFVVDVVITCLIGIVAILAVCFSGKLYWGDIEEIKDNANKMEESLETLQKRVANLTSKTKDLDKSEVSMSRTTSLLSNQTKQLKHDYEQLLREMRALNKTINYTTSSTVQRAFDELRSVKKTQKDIQKKLEALSHLNDTAEDYLNLRNEVKILSTEVNQNITRVEKTVKDNSRELKVLNDETSEIKSNISKLEEKFKNRTIVSEAVTVFDKTSNYIMRYGIMLFTSLYVAQA